jgi:hypothetical protein
MLFVSRTIMDERKMKANTDMDSDVTDRSGTIPVIILLQSDLKFLLLIKIGRQRILKMTSCRIEKFRDSLDPEKFRTVRWREDKSITTQNYASDYSRLVTGRSSTLCESTTTATGTVYLSLVETSNLRHF